MSLLTENIMPGDQGKVFGTNAKHEKDLERIKNLILEVDGILDVEINHDTFPRQLVIHVSEIVEVKTVADKVKPTGFHVKPKSLF